MSRFVNIKQIESFEVDLTHTRRFTPPLFSLSSFSTSYLLYTSLHTLTLTHTLTHTHSHTTNNNTLSPLPTHTLTHTHTHIHTHNHIQHLHFLLKSTHLGRLDFSKSSRLYWVDFILHASQLGRVDSTWPGWVDAPVVNSTLGPAHWYIFFEIKE